MSELLRWSILILRAMIFLCTLALIALLVYFIFLGEINHAENIIIILKCAGAIMMLAFLERILFKKFNNP